MRAMCRAASGSRITFLPPKPRSLSDSARSIASSTSASVSGSNWKMRHRLTMAGVMATSGFSVVEPMKRTTPRSMAGRMESDWDLLQRWHSSSSRYVA